MRKTMYHNYDQHAGKVYRMNKYQKIAKVLEDAYKADRTVTTLDIQTAVWDRFNTEVSASHVSRFVRAWEWDYVAAWVPMSIREANHKAYLKEEEARLKELLRTSTSQKASGDSQGSVPQPDRRP
jgi:hypothetical protein